MTTSFIATAFAGILVCAGIGTAQANTITGNLWHVSEATSQNAIPANVPGTTPDVTFSVNSPFNFSGTSVSVGTWLASSSPCGTTVDRNTSQLMYMAERVFPALKTDPPVVEALLLPFSLKGKTVGTIWVVAHDEARKFDVEDERVVTTLAQFASAAWQLWTCQAASETTKAKLEDKVMELEHLHDIVVGRELKMMQLEKEYEALKQSLQKVRP